MDMTPEKKEILWVFDDNDSLPMPGQYVKCEIEMSQSGTKYPVITLDNTGQKIKLSMWRTDLSECIKAYGKDDAAWVGKWFNVSKNPKKKGLVLSPMEAKI